jgi:FixJ family two-component response regulator
LPKLLLICVVDDDESVREALGDLFAGHGYSVNAFSGAQELLDFPDLPRGDCVVSDYHMPGTNGMELFHAMRDRGLTTPFVLMTAFATDQLRASARKAGVSCVLEKPFEPGEMLQCVEAAIG